MTDLQTWRQERSKSFRETLAEAKELKASEKLKLLQALTADLQETERLARLLDERIPNG